MKKYLILATLAIGALVGASTLSVFASGIWTGPTELPPAGNVATPINIGALLQEKTGSLLLDGNLGVLGNLIIANGSPAAGKVLTALDNTGTATWADVSTTGTGSGGVYDYQLLTQTTTNAQGSVNGLSCPFGKKVLSGSCLVPAGTSGGPFFLQNTSIDNNGTTFQCMFNKSDGSQPPIQIQTQVVCGTPASSGSGISGGSNGGTAAVTSVTGSGAGISVSPTVGDVIISNTGVTRITPGNGLSLNTGTGTVMISADTTFLQKRISGACPSGQAVQSINTDGSVRCVNLSTSSSGPTTQNVSCNGGQFAGCSVTCSPGYMISSWSCIPDFGASYGGGNASCAIPPPVDALGHFEFRGQGVCTKI